MDGFQNRVAQQTSFDDVPGTVAHDDEIGIVFMGIGQEIGFGVPVHQVSMNFKSVGLAVVCGFFQQKRFRFLAVREMDQPDFSPGPGI
jgi:hypothetical protein